MFNTAVNTLQDFERKGKLKIETYYFADKISNDPLYEGTSDQGQVLLSAISTKNPDNVVILTDNDLSGLN